MTLSPTETTISEPVGGSGNGRHSFGPRIWAWIRRSWVPLVLILASLAMVGTVTASHTKQFSPFDEWVYYDYVVKIPSQLVVREGEPIGPQALKAMSCFGDSYGPRGEPCDGGPL